MVIIFLKYLISELLAIDLNSDDHDCGIPQEKVDFIYGVIFRLDTVSAENKEVSCGV